MFFLLLEKKNLMWIYSNFPSWICQPFREDTLEIVSKTTSSVRDNFSHITYVKSVKSAREKYAIALLPKKEINLLGGNKICSKISFQTRKKGPFFTVFPHTNLYVICAQPLIVKILFFYPWKNEKHSENYEKSLYSCRENKKPYVKILNCAGKKFGPTVKSCK